MGQHGVSLARRLGGKERGRTRQKAGKANATCFGSAIARSVPAKILTQIVDADGNDGTAARGGLQRQRQWRSRTSSVCGPAASQSGNGEAATGKRTCGV